MSALRQIAEPFVVAPPSGAWVRTRLRVDESEAAVLWAVGTYLGSRAGTDLAARCRQGRLDAQGRAESRRERKRSLTERSSSRWAGAITRSVEDSWQLGYRNLLAERRSLTRRVRGIRGRLAIPAGHRQGTIRGYASGAERFEKQRRLQILEHRLADAERDITAGRVSVCRGGGRLARTRHNLGAAGLTERQWRLRWDAQRLFITADGDASKLLGNLTIRWHPDERWLEIRLPRPLEHLANRPGGRYRLGGPVAFSYRGDEVAAQATSGAVRYDITFSPKKHRWYLDASWKCATTSSPSLGELRAHRVLAIDCNHGHLAACIVDPSGNPVGRPFTLGMELAGLPAPTRDGRLRAAISGLIEVAQANACRAIVVENLDFADSREEGRERSGNRPSRGQRGKAFRRVVAGLPTAKFRARLVQMAANRGCVVIAVDPAFTSKWGAEHLLGVLQLISTEASGHHAAALVIGRRGLGHRARRREGCASSRAEYRQERATNSVVRGVTKPIRKPVEREAKGLLHPQRKTRKAKRTTTGDQVAQDRSGPPTGQDIHFCSVTRGTVMGETLTHQASDECPDR